MFTFWPRRHVDTVASQRGVYAGSGPRSTAAASDVADDGRDDEEEDADLGQPEQPFDDEADDRQHKPDNEKKHYETDHCIDSILPCATVDLRLRSGVAVILD